MSGWIKLYRNTLENPVVCKDADHLVVWVHLLLNATHKPYDIMVGKERITLQPGQLATSRKSLSEKTKVSESKVERILKLFKIEQQIEQQSYSSNRIISILNWNKYQESEQQTEQQVNSEWTASEQQVNTNKNYKNIKNKRIKEINNKTAFEEYTSNPTLIESLESFIEFRKSIKKPMTDKAIKLMLGKLDKLAKDDQEKIAVLEQSILNGWQGIFELKDKGGNAYKRSRDQTRQGKPNIPTVSSNQAETISAEELEEIRALARKMDGGKP